MYPIDSHNSRALSVGVNLGVLFMGPAYVAPPPGVFGSPHPHQDPVPVPTSSPSYPGGPQTARQRETASSPPPSWSSAGETSRDTAPPAP